MSTLLLSLLLQDSWNIWWTCVWLMTDISKGSDRHLALSSEDASGWHRVGTVCVWQLIVKQRNKLDYWGSRQGSSNLSISVLLQGKRKLVNQTEADKILWPSLFPSVTGEGSSMMLHQPFLALLSFEREKKWLPWILILVFPRILWITLLAFIVLVASWGNFSRIVAGFSWR